MKKGSLILALHHYELHIFIAVSTWHIAYVPGS